MTFFVIDFTLVIIFSTTKEDDDGLHALDDGNISIHVIDFVFCFFLFTKKGGDDGLHALDDGDSGEPAAARGVP